MSAAVEHGTIATAPSATVMVGAPGTKKGDTRSLASDPLERATAVRLRLRDAGFSPIPVNGKIPKLPGWQKLGGASAEEIALWAITKKDHTNTGALAANTPALDIDLHDPIAADAVERLARDRFGDCGAFLVRLGRAPKRAIPFKTAEPFPKIKIVLIAPDGTDQAIELLGDGQQLVVDGIHPDTHQPYRWVGGEPGDVSLDELPPINAVEARQLVDDAAELLVAEHGYKKPEKPKPAAGNGSDTSRTFSAPVSVRELAYAGAALDGNAAELAAMGIDDFQNDTLNAIAFRMGRMIARDWIERQQVEDVLTEAMDANGYVAGWGIGAVRATLRSGIDKGMLEPHPDLIDQDAQIEAEVAEANRNTSTFEAAIKPHLRLVKDDVTLQPERREDEAAPNEQPQPEGESDTAHEEPEPQPETDAGAEQADEERKASKDGPSSGAALGLDIRNAGDNVEPPPPREWLLGNTFCRKFMSSLLADGGVGKTAIRYVDYLSLATGRALIGEHVFQRARVLVISLEDDEVELRRRMLAARIHYNIGAADIDGWLFYCCPGAAGGKLMTTDRAGRAVRGRLAAGIEAVVVKHSIDLVAIDPFVKSHSIPENDNSLIDEVIQVLTDLAAKYNIAIDVSHHTSKGLAEPGNANRGRGASAMVNAGRLVTTLAPMSGEEAKAFGIAEADRKQYVRVDNGKVNIIRGGGNAKWFRLIGVRLNNGNEHYPSGDEVQTVVMWVPPEMWAGLSDELLDQVLAEIDNGLPDGQRYSDAPNAGDELAAWRVVTKFAPMKAEGQARKIIQTWVKGQTLLRKSYDNPVTRKDAKGLYLNPARKPGREDIF